MPDLPQPQGQNGAGAPQMPGPGGPPSGSMAGFPTSQPPAGPVSSASAAPTTPQGSPPTAQYAGGQGQPTATDLAIRSLAQQGLNVGSFASDAELAQYLQQQQQHQQQLQYLAAIGQRAYPHLAEFEEFQRARASQQGQPQPGQPAPQAEPEGYWPKRPEWRDEWANLIEVGQDGVARMKQGYEFAANPAIVDHYNKYKQWQRDRLNSLLEDPVEAIGKGLEERFEQWAQSRGLVRKEEIQAERDTQFAQAFIHENASWLFAQDQAGQVMVNPANGKPVPTEAGIRFEKNLAVAKNYGVVNQEAAAQMALKMTFAEMTMEQQAAGQVAVSQQAQMQTPGGQPPNAGSPPPTGPMGPTRNPGAGGWHTMPLNPNEPFLGNAGFAPNRAGTAMPSPISAPQNRLLSYREALMQQAQARGLVTG